MRRIHCDIETFSSVNLTKCGVYKYAEGEDFEILLFGVSVDGAPVIVYDLASGDKLPTEIREALTDPSVIKTAHNANFERVCLSRLLGFPPHTYLPPQQWRCTMTWAAYMGLPLSLKGVGSVLGLDKQKMDEGKDLIKYFCVPCAPTKANKGRTRNRPEDAPEKWALFKSYNARDVEVEMQIEEKLSRFPVPDSVWDQYFLSEEINDRGIGVDMDLVENAIRIDGEVREELKRKMTRITELENPNSVQQLLGWLGENGVETTTLGKKEVKKLIEEQDGEVREALLLRQQLAKSSVKKYVAMENAVCADGRIRGCFMFYGANRTGRFSGRLVQLQNLPQNHLSDLGEARELVRQGNIEALRLLYSDIPDTLSQLIRTAFIASPGNLLYVADFSAIEARVLSWLAGEQWRMDVFEKGGDIYCETASRMFGVPVEKHGRNSELRQKGKQAELACIAEGQLVLTDRGEVPIEEVKVEDKVWDGKEWVSHDGVIFRGEREVITYDGLTATPDHIVFIKGQSEPVQFGFAAASSAHLVQTGNGGRAIRMGEDYQPGKKVESETEPLLCFDGVPGVRINSVAESEQSERWQIEGMSELYTEETDTPLVGQASDCSKAEVRESERSTVQELWGERHKVRLPECDGSRALFDDGVRTLGQKSGVGSDRRQRGLYTRQPEICREDGKSGQQEDNCTEPFRTGVLALCGNSGQEETVRRPEQGRNNIGRGKGGGREKEELAFNKRTARLYDIRNAGRHHRFTVSGKLVHNCGYGGSVGALKAMGAIEAGMAEEELAPLVQAWRTASPNIVRFWWAVDRAAKQAVFHKEKAKVGNLTFRYESGFLFITLPSGRELAYVKPRKGQNKFGEDAITYEGVGGTKKWERLETYGPKLVENIVQGISRDILCYAMSSLREKKICMHIHDELVIEGQEKLEEICEVMGHTPPWAEGLNLRADGYLTPWYKKD